MGGRIPDDDERPERFRRIDVPEAGAGMRLDRFLAARFAEWTRSALARFIRAGWVTDAGGRPLRASATLVAGQEVRLHVPGLAPDGPPPPLPPVLYEDARVLVLDKPAGLACHPGGTRFAWAVVGLARERWASADLVHRLDRDTSGALVLTKDVAANAFLKRVFKEGGADKEYVALCRGRLDWDARTIDAPIGAAEGPIRIQMAVRDDGLPARTDAVVEARQDAMTRVRCTLHTGRTHQIRVHLAHVADGVVGDRMYGVPPAVFLHFWEIGLDEWVIERAGAPRQALHAARVRFPHPDGGTVDVTSPLPDDLARWWADPSVLPLDQ